MKIIALFLVVAVACDPSWSPSDFPGAKVRPVATADNYDMWVTHVTKLTSAWAAAVAPFGCEAPFVLAPDDVDAYPVKLVEPSDWDEPDLIGACWYNRIEVLHNSVISATLAHELGHAMGLEHHDEEFGQSIMDNTGAPRVVTEGDARAAACQLGCGPCDTIDEYDQGF